MSVIYIIVAEPTLIINDVADLHKWFIASYGHYCCGLRTQDCLFRGPDCTLPQVLYSLSKGLPICNSSSESKISIFYSAAFEYTAFGTFKAAFMV